MSEHSLNLKALFANKCFRVPDYQRGYAWGEKQLNDLWDDIQEINKTGKNEDWQKHYTGTIFVEKMNTNSLETSDQWAKNKEEFFFVVDGQQRLTTIVILIFELLKAEKNGYDEESKEDLIKTFIKKTNSSGNSCVYRFGYQNEMNDFLKKVIFEDKTIIVKEKEPNVYTENLRSAKNFFSEKIQHLSEEDREVIFEKVNRALIFDFRTVEEDELDVQAVFETMNNRGKSLTILEKLKNRIIYLSTKISRPIEDKIKLRKEINKSWSIIYTYLAKNPNYILDEDEFLSAFLSIYRKPKYFVFSEAAAGEKVFQMFCNRSSSYTLSDEGNEKEPDVTYDKISDFVEKISDFVVLWYDTNNSKDILVKKILLLENGKETKVFLSVLNDKSYSNKRNECLQLVEKVLFRNNIPGLWVMDNRTLATTARELYNNKISINDVIDDFKKNNDEEANVEELQRGFHQLFDYIRGNKGFYRWTKLPYFLYEYENYLKEKYKETTNIISIDDIPEMTIEHILPQDYQKNWGKEMEDYLNDIPVEDQEYGKKVLINTLGNLTLLKQAKNSSLGNEAWADKKERYSTGSYSERNIEKSFQEWNKNTIKERGFEMLTFLEDKVDCLKIKITDDMKEEILFCEKKYFVK
jgi:uncharacterized protein with ParB-like and HNH nuclease domain